MGTNALLNATRSKRIDLGLPVRGLDQLRVSPTTFSVLLEEKPADQSWADFTIRALVSFVVIRRMIALETQAANRIVVRLGLAWPDDTAEDLTSVSAPDDSQRRPLTKTPAR